MSSSGSAEIAARRAGSGIARMARAWRAMPPNRQLAAAAAIGLWLTLFLPWYQETGFVGGRSLQTKAASLTGWHAFSWVEAAVLLVAISVLMLLFLRAEGRAFHLPGGDGFIVMAAGGWTCALVIWRILDKQGTTSNSQFGTTFGIKWGIFTALAVAALLTYAGARIRAAHLPEPLLPGEEPGRVGSGERASRRAQRAAAAGGGPAATAGGSPRGGAPRDGTAAAGGGALGARGAEARKAKRDQAARRASWAEPVTWEQPPALSEPPRASGPEPAPTEAPTAVSDPTRGDEPTEVLEATSSGPPEHARRDLSHLPARSTPEHPAGAHRRRRDGAQLRIPTDDEPPA